jgi:uncharacterized protein YciI
VKYVLSYVSPPDLDMEKVGAHFEAHRARWKVFHEQGTLLLIGPFADPRDGAMAVFTTREAAEEFAATDPFVLHGVVAAWTIKEWNEVLL